MSGRFHFLKHNMADVSVHAGHRDTRAARSIGAVPQPVAWCLHRCFRWQDLLIEPDTSREDGDQARGGAGVPDGGHVGGFQVIHRRGRNVGVFVGALYSQPMSGGFGRRRGNAATAGEPDAANQGVDRVAVAHGVVEPLQDQHHGALANEFAACCLICCKGHSRVARQIDSPDERGVHFALLQHSQGRIECVNAGVFLCRERKTRPAEREFTRNPAGSDARQSAHRPVRGQGRVGDITQVRVGNRPAEGVVRRVEIQSAADKRSRPQAHFFGKTNLLKRIGGDAEQEELLRQHLFQLARRNAKTAGVDRHLAQEETRERRAPLAAEPVALLDAPPVPGRFRFDWQAATQQPLLHRASDFHGPTWAAIATTAIGEDAGRGSGMLFAAAAGMYSSSRRWALMPPKPKALTAARRGTSGARRCQAAAVERIRNGDESRSIAGAGVSKFAVGGNRPVRNAASTFVTPAAPAAVSRWPTVAFTEPRMH